jgi:hypothetical protein
LLVKRLNNQKIRMEKQPTQQPKITKTKDGKQRRVIPVTDYVEPIKKGGAKNG